VNDLSKLPPTAWVLIGCAAALGFGAALAWRWYRQYRARKALRVAVTGGAADHLVDTLVPDGTVSSRKSTWKPPPMPSGTSVSTR